MQLFRSLNKCNSVSFVWIMVFLGLLCSLFGVTLPSPCEIIKRNWDLCSLCWDCWVWEIFESKINKQCKTLHKLSHTRVQNKVLTKLWQNLVRWLTCKKWKLTFNDVLHFQKLFKQIFMFLKKLRKLYLLKVSFKCQRLSSV